MMKDLFFCPKMKMMRLEKQEGITLIFGIAQHNFKARLEISI